MRASTMAALIVVAALAAACGEKPQTASGRKADAQAWDAAKGAYVAQGWKAGDQASWEEQIHNRAQNQNEYTRAPATGK